MMKINIKLIAICLVAYLVSLSSCKPSVELDDSLYGNKAELTSVVLFEQEEVTNKLGFNEAVTGIKQNGVSADVVIDKDNGGDDTIIGQNPTITITVASTVDLTKIGIRFTHFAKNIVPVDGAPPAGIIGDFSSGPFVYRVYSADGSIRDWTITFITS